MVEFTRVNPADNPKDEEGKTARDREHAQSVKDNGSIDLPPNAQENVGKDFARDPALYNPALDEAMASADPAGDPAAVAARAKEAQALAVAEAEKRDAAERQAADARSAAEVDAEPAEEVAERRKRR